MLDCYAPRDGTESYQVWKRVRHEFDEIRKIRGKEAYLQAAAEMKENAKAMNQGAAGRKEGDGFFKGFQDIFSSLTNNKDSNA